MKWLKRTAAAGMTAVMLFSCLPAAGAVQPGEELTRGETASILLEAATDYNADVTYGDILKGYPGGDLNEDGAVTRAQALVMLQRAFGGLPEPKGDNARSGYPAANFTDIPAWAQAELEDVLASGIVAGTSATTFSPDRKITKEQLELFLQRTYALEGSNLKDDFYATVNKEALDNSVIRPGYLGASAFYDLGAKVDEEIAGIIQELVDGGAKTEGEKKIVNFYRNILNIEARNAEGIAPIQPYLDAIDQAKTIEELMAVQNRVYEETGGTLFMGFGLNIDVKDNTAYTLLFDGITPSLGQGGYSTATPEQKAAYQTYVRTMLTLVWQSEAAASAAADTIWRVDAKIAAASLSNQELADVDKTYNIYTMEQLQAMFPRVDLEALFALTGLTQTNHIQVMDPGKLQAWAEIFDEGKTPDGLEILKTYARLYLAAGFGPALNEEFTEAGNAFSEAYMGSSGALSLEDSAAQYVQQVMSDYLGQAYVDRYFSAEAKADVEKMVQDILAVYRDRIETLDWMSETTKEKAIEKLDTIQINIGYPDDWDDTLKDVEILSAEQGGSFCDNLIAIQKGTNKLLAELQKTGVDENIWPMTTYTVNAGYLFTANSITFPAGILQEPFYDVDASYEENLGKVGYVIAHEITHAFDNNGAKYDENGNAVDWWTQEDYAAFQTLCEKVVKLYDGKESAPGITCNGALTLSENIADLGSVACLTEIESKRENPDYAALYTAMAEIWCSSYPRETRLYLAQADVHAPDKLRGSLVLQNFSEFYEAFDITEEDAMWLPPEERVVIW